MLKHEVVQFIVHWIFISKKAKIFACVEWIFAQLVNWLTDKNRYVPYEENRTFLSLSPNWMQDKCSSSASSLSRHIFQESDTVTMILNHTEHDKIKATYALLYLC